MPNSPSNTVSFPQSEGQTQRKQPFTYAEFEQIYSRVPRLTVDLVVMTEGGVVLVKRQEQSWHGMWHLPGGTVLYREKIEDSVQRIAAEELGLSVAIEKLLGYIEYPSELQERGFGYSVSLTFLCRADSSQIDWLRWSEQEIQVFESVPENTVVEQVEVLRGVLEGKV